MLHKVFTKSRNDALIDEVEDQDDQICLPLDLAGSPVWLAQIETLCQDVADQRGRSGVEFINKRGFIQLWRIPRV